MPRKKESSLRILSWWKSLSIFPSLSNTLYISLSVIWLILGLNIHLPLISPFLSFYVSPWFLSTERWEKNQYFIIQESAIIQLLGKSKNSTLNHLYWWYKGDKRIKLNGKRHLNKSIHNISILKLSMAMTLKYLNYVDNISYLKIKLLLYHSLNLSCSMDYRIL